MDKSFLHLFRAACAALGATAVLSLSGCAVVSVAGAAVSVAGTAVSVGVSAGSAVVGAAGSVVGAVVP